MRSSCRSLQSTGMKINLRIPGSVLLSFRRKRTMRKVKFWSIKENTKRSWRDRRWTNSRMSQTRCEERRGMTIWTVSSYPTLITGEDIQNKSGVQNSCLLVFTEITKSRVKGWRTWGSRNWNTGKVSRSSLSWLWKIRTALRKVAIEANSTHCQQIAVQWSVQQRRIHCLRTEIRRCFTFKAVITRWMMIRAGKVFSSNSSVLRKGRKKK